MTIKDIALELKKHNKILVFTHVRPDGDTLGSAFATKFILEKMGKIADVVVCSEIPEKYTIFDCVKFALTFSQVTDKYDCHLAVDCSTENMIGNSFALFSSCKNTVNVDHHVSNTRYAKHNFVEDRASCCEIIYSLSLALGVELDSNIASLLALGVVTDTGNFMHSNVTENTFSVASKLISNGAKFHDISYAMFKNQKIERAKLYASVIDKMRLFENGKIAIISVFNSDFEKFSATQDMTEGFIDFPLSVEGVEVAVSIMETKLNHYKVSFRSKGKIDVNDVASTFGGGGHVLASGCMISGFYEDVKDKIIRAISINF